jgi:hypothetical protein
MQLNLVLHGTWGIENNPDGIRLVTIDDHHHAIVAGHRDDAKSQHDLRRNKEYRLEGVIGGAPTNFRADQNITVDARIDRIGRAGPIRADPGKVRVIVDFRTRGRFTLSGGTRPMVMSSSGTTSRARRPKSQPFRCWSMTCPI